MLKYILYNEYVYCMSEKDLKLKIYSGKILLREQFDRVTIRLSDFMSDNFIPSNHMEIYWHDYAGSEGRCYCRAKSY